MTISVHILVRKEIQHHLLLYHDGRALLVEATPWLREPVAREVDTLCVWGGGGCGCGWVVGWGERGGVEVGSRSKAKSQCGKLVICQASSFAG